MNLEEENPKLKAILLVLLVVLVAAVIITVYFISREARKEPVADTTGEKEQVSEVKPLTAEEIQQALEKTSQPADTESGETAVEPLTTNEIQSALEKTTTDAKPLSAEEIQSALQKTK